MECSFSSLFRGGIMCFPETLIVFLAKKVLCLKKELCKKETAKIGRKLTSHETEELMHKAFQSTLKYYAKESDWKELKSAIGKKMNQWRREKEIEREARLLIALEEIKESNIEEMKRICVLENLEQDSPTVPLELE